MAWPATTTAAATTDYLLLAVQQKEVKDMLIILKWIDVAAKAIFDWY